MTERERLYELIVDAENKFFRETPCGTDSSRIEKVVEHLLANGVILPPVTVGQTVYIISDYTHEIIERSIVKVIVTEDHYDFIFDTQSCWRDTEIGKTVFLTREEAEAELERRRKEVNTT